MAASRNSPLMARRKDRLLSHLKRKSLLASTFLSHSSFRGLSIPRMSSFFLCVSIRRRIYLLRTYIHTSLSLSLSYLFLYLYIYIVAPRVRLIDCGVFFFLTFANSPVTACAKHLRLTLCKPAPRHNVRENGRKEEALFLDSACEESRETRFP